MLAVLALVVAAAAAQTITVNYFRNSITNSKFVPPHRDQSDMFV